jgi:predicted RNA-binding protein with PIN domain
MRVYVDGNDLVEAFAAEEADFVVADEQAASRLHVARWLARWTEHRDCDVVLVWDNNPAGEVLPPTERHGRVLVINLQAGADAMHEIAGPANRAARHERVLVATSDRWLTNALQRGAAKVLKPRDFIALARRAMRGGQEDYLDEPDEKFSGLSQEEVEFWVRFFKDDNK